MNSYKRKAARIRKDYVWSTGYNLLDSTHCPENLLEEFLRVLTSCTALTCIKFMCKHGLIMDIKTRSLIGVSLHEMANNPLYAFTKPLHSMYWQDDIDESYFGV